MKRIWIPSARKYALVDDCDYPLLSRHNWHLSHGYATTCIRRCNYYMHRMVRPGWRGTETDHINQRKLDNRGVNLRVASKAENRRNRGLRADNTTGFKGVSFCKRSGKFAAYASVKGKALHIGYFKTARLAAQAYNQVAKKIYGAFASLNPGC